MMRKLALTLLAASAAFVPAGAGALAQPAGAHQGPTHAQMRQHGGDVVRHRPGMNRGPHHGGRFRHIQRINRGALVPHFWFGPQFVVRNWGMYGFPQPVPDRRWVRYYDDALLIDRDGRVHDGRYGMDWDQYEDEWGYDDSGIPAYVGDGDYRPDDEDYEWVERREDDDRYARHGGQVYGHGQGYPAPACHNPCGQGHGYGASYGGYGYGYGYGYGPMIVTETITTTTTAPVMETRTYYENVEEVVRVKPRVRRAPPRPCNCRAPQPIPQGERG